MRKHILLLATLTTAILWATDASAQYRGPRPGPFQPRPRPVNAPVAQFEFYEAPAELDLHLSVTQIDGGLILGGRYTHSITDLIGVEGGFDHDHGNGKSGEKVLVFGDLRWQLGSTSSATSTYVTVGVAAGGGYSFSVTPYLGLSGRGSCSEPLCLRYDMTFYPAVQKLTERFRGSVGVSVSLR